MTRFRFAFACAAAMGLSLAFSGAASAMPVGPMGSDVDAAAAGTALQKARWVCGPYGCVWRPNYYRPYPYYGGGYGYGGPRYYGGGYGYGRGYGYGGRRRW